MSNPQKQKGNLAEREVATILSDLLGYECKRALGAGRKEDTGDVWGLPDTIVQVANWADLNRAVREKLPDVDIQMKNAKATFGALFARRRGGKYVVILTPEQWATLWREATGVSPSDGSAMIPQKGDKSHPTSEVD